MINWNKVNHFSASEWLYDPSKAAPELVFALDSIRSRANVPIYIHVCWAEDGHASNSYHYTGQAVDFRFGGKHTAIEEFLFIVAQPEIGGIGFYPDWGPRPGWHADIRPGTDGKLFWSFVEGGYHYDFKTFSRVIKGFSL